MEAGETAGGHPGSPVGGGGGASRRGCGPVSHAPESLARREVVALVESGATRGVGLQRIQERNGAAGETASPGRTISRSISFDTHTSLLYFTAEGTCSEREVPGSGCARSRAQVTPERSHRASCSSIPSASHPLCASYSTGDMG